MSAWEAIALVMGFGSLLVSAEACRAAREGRRDANRLWNELRDLEDEVETWRGRA